MKRIGFALAAGMMLAGCSTGDSPGVKQPAETPTSDPTSSSTTASSAIADESPNASGNYDHELGKPTGVRGCGPGGEESCLEMVMNATKLEDSCDATSEPPKNGKYLFVDLTVTTGPNADQLPYVLDWPLRGDNWSVRTDSNVVTSDIGQWEENAALCSGTVDWAKELMPDATYKGVMVFDVPEDTRSVMLKIPNPDGVEGWEWPVG